jgi:hypothetical protein
MREVDAFRCAAEALRLGTLRDTSSCRILESHARRESSREAALVSAIP